MFAWVFVVLFLAVMVMGAYGWHTGRFPGNQRQTLQWGDRKVSITNMGVLLVIFGLVGAVIVWGFLVPERADPPGPAPTPHVGPAVANSPQQSGPWQAESNGVVLTVATVTYEEDHLAQVRYRIDNTSAATVDGQSDYFSVVDNFGRARNADLESSSLPERLTLSPGQTAFARAQVALPWDTTTEFFDVRLNLSFTTSKQFFTIASPGIPIPKSERVGG
ncbi:hypothetical protein [Microlunatus flavus]|uniref:Uncharacterized protein n=1 Tax=Microlunatus flavus TaxID=1036181 RepID=A0A1H9LLM1_9ACTN|nr:hypothetical protein [Microlunatus flavus]SER12097.1 hypothetical protein SAMN05421756_1095 [Microlunatus flavus]